MKKIFKIVLTVLTMALALSTVAFFGCSPNETKDEKTYKIVFDFVGNDEEAGGSLPTGSNLKFKDGYYYTEVKKGEKINLLIPNFDDENYDFSGYKVEGTEDVLSVGTTTFNYDGDIKLIANYSKVTKYKIYFDLKGNKATAGASVPDGIGATKSSYYVYYITVKKGESYVVFTPNLTNKDVAFECWYIKDTENKVPVGDKVFNGDSDVTLVACYKELELPEWTQ